MNNKTRPIIGTLVALMVAFGLFIYKYSVSKSTGSLTVLASSYDSIFDFFTSSLNFIALLIASKPTDRDHRYGHEKAEALASFTQSIILFVIVGILFYQTYLRFNTPLELRHPETAITAMIVSLVMTILLVLFQRFFVLRHTDNLVTQADSLHYLGDIITNIIIVFSLFIQSNTSTLHLDTLLAVILGLILLKGIFEIFKKSIDILMDKDYTYLFNDTIQAIQKRYEHINDIHGLRSRRSGDTYFIEIHIEVDKEMTVEKSHELGLKVTHEINKVHPNTEVVFHIDPEDDSN
jgi:ferrous-iron efflux pump FieF